MNSDLANKLAAQAGNAPVPSDFIESAHIAFGDALLGEAKIGLIAAAHGKTVLVSGIERPSAAELVVVTPNSLEVEGVVRCLAIDAKRGRIAVAGDSKTVLIFDVKLATPAEGKTQPTFSIAPAAGSVGPFNKRIVALCFDEATGNLYSGDKFGELYCARFDAATGAPVLDPKMVLSHMSMITRIAIRKNTLVTCDRDGCIRVSRLDLPDDIRGFLWAPEVGAKAILGDQIEDSVTTSVAWVGDDMITGTLEGLVMRWRDVAKDGADIDGSGAASQPVCAAPAGTPVAGFVGGASGLDGDIVVHYDGAPGAGSVVAGVNKVAAAAPMSVIAAEGPVLLLRDGSIAASFVLGGEIVTVATPLRFDHALEKVAVKDLWHTRMPARAGDNNSNNATAGDNDGPSAKKGPRSEAV